MPVKKPQKDLLKKYTDVFLSLIFSKLEDGIDKLSKDFIDTTQIKKKLQRYIISMIIILASITIIFYGLGTMLGQYFQNWLPGLSYVVVGLIFSIVAILYKNLK